MSRDKVYNSAMADYDAELIVQRGKFALSENRGDVEGQAEALKEMAAIEVQKQMAHQIAVQDARGMQAAIPKGNKYGLTREERESALLISSDHPGLPKLSKDDKFKAYIKGKQQYARFQATGKREAEDGDDEE
jgi:hypothetical protein